MANRGAFFFDNILITIDMNRRCISKENLIDLVAAMWDLGISINLDPEQSQVTIYKRDGGYEWINVLDKDSVSNIVATYLPNADEQEG